MESSLSPILLVLLLVLAAEFVNGWTDAPNAIATVVATRVLGPWQALGMAAVLNTLGAMSGTAVAATIGKGIVQPQAIGLSRDGGPHRLEHAALLPRGPWTAPLGRPRATRASPCPPRLTDVTGARRAIIRASVP